MMSPPGKPWLASYGAGMNPHAGEPPCRLLGDIASQQAQLHPEKPAFTCVMPNGMQGTLTWREVDRLSSQFAACLAGHLCLPPGARVAVQAPNGLAYPVVAFGIFRAGCVLVNINPLYKAEETAAILADAQASVLVVIDLFAEHTQQALALTRVDHVILVRAAEFFPALSRTVIGLVQTHIRRQIPRPAFAHIPLPQALAEGRRMLAGGMNLRELTEGLGPHSLACLQYTGGTTGVSKGAMLTHGNLAMNVAQIHAFAGDRISSADTIMTALPLYHIFAFTVNFLAFAARGAHVVMVPSPRPLSNLKKAFQKYPVSFITGVNTLFNGLLNERWFTTMRHSRLKVCIAGGMALHEAVAERWLNTVGVPLGQGYGLTEASPVVCFSPFGLPRAGSIGVPLPDTDVKCVDADFNEVAPGQQGELVIRGPQVMAGYWQQPDETASVIHEGWLRTGDIAVMSPDGYFSIVDRSKDIILVSGFNVYPGEVENVITRLAGVKEAAVVGVADEHAGEVPKAFVVRTDMGVTEQSVRNFCRQHLTGYKVPRFVEFRDELPKSSVGKILRRELRA